MDLTAEVDVLLRGRATLICVSSVEEERVLEKLVKVAEGQRLGLYLWDHADHFQKLAGAAAADPAPAKDPLTALESIERVEGPCLFVLRDFHQCCDAKAPRVVRKLRSLCEALKYTQKSIVLIQPRPELPDELKDLAVQLELPLPDADDLDAILGLLERTPGVRLNVNPAQRFHLIRSALGLTANQAQRVFARAIVNDGVLDLADIESVASAKQEIVRAAGCALEYFLPRETIADVGGLEELKRWLRLRARSFSPEAIAYGLPPPRGILLLGIPGTGKSLTAKAIASMWRMALLRLDAGALFGSLVGQSEENTRRALAIAERVAPCILWIDEVEKALASGDRDGGTSLRVLGTILSWLQERRKPVFVVATANDISRLPPELLRRGRLDEIFFLDLPATDERRAIVEVHLRKRKRDPARFDVPALVQASQGFVGAEIEQAIVDAMYAAFNDESSPRRELTTDDVIAAMGRLVPLSRSQSERIGELRRWLAEGRARSASIPEVIAMPAHGIPLAPRRP